jgi:hypothetical protein
MRFFSPKLLRFYVLCVLCKARIGCVLIPAPGGLIGLPLGVSGMVEGFDGFRLCGLPPFVFKELQRCAGRLFAPGSFESGRSRLCRPGIAQNGSQRSQVILDSLLAHLALPTDNST